MAKRKPKREWVKPINYKAITIWLEPAQHTLLEKRAKDLTAKRRANGSSTLKVSKAEFIRLLINKFSDQVTD